MYLLDWYPTYEAAMGKEEASKVTRIGHIKSTMIGLYGKPELQLKASESIHVFTISRVPTQGEKSLHS